MLIFITIATVNQKIVGGEGILAESEPYQP